MRIDSFLRRVGPGAVLVVVPAAVFLLAGLGKVLAPPSSPPSLLSWMDGDGYRLAMRGLGAVECVLAWLLLWPRTRLPGAAGSLLALAGFSVFAALSSRDPGFAASCGCFGEWTPAAGGGSAPAVLLRNAVLALLLFALWRPRPVPAIAFAAIWVSAGFWIREVDRRGHAEGLVSRLIESHRGGDRWRLPDLPLVTAGGIATTTRRTLQPGDRLVVFSADCPHCHDLARHWNAMDRQLRPRGGRLVPIALESGPGLRRFVGEHRLHRLPVLALADRFDHLRLRIDAVPAVLQLGAGHEVVSHEGQRNTGAMVVPAAPRGAAPDAATLVSAPRPAAFSVTLAVYHDGAGVIDRVERVAAGGYATSIDPERRLERTLSGLPIPVAIRMARALGAGSTFAAPIWRSIGDSLAMVPGPAPSR